MSKALHTHWKKQHESYDHVLKYTGIFGFVQVLKMAMNLVRNMLTARLLGPFGMGLNAKFQNIADQVNAATNFGLSFSSVRSLSELYEEGTDEEMSCFVGVIRTWCLWAALIGALGCLAVAVVLHDFYFTSGDGHRLEIMLLSLFVASLPVEAGECSILKGIRRLRTVALIESLVVISTLLFTLPIYYMMGVRGVVLSLVLCGWAKVLLHLFYTTRIFPYRVHLCSRRVFEAGQPLLLVGFPYMLAAVAGAATTGLVFKSLDSETTVGLYRAGYSLMVTYAGMVFVAVEADYFPRLSAVNHDQQHMNRLINQQIDVCVLLMAPLLIAMVLGMPWVIDFLYGSEFATVVPMSLCAVFYMFFKAVTTPIAYTPLAKGHSIVYLLMECLYDVVFLGILWLGYHHWGLTGAGLALSAAAFFDLVLVGLVYGAYYGFRLRLSSLRLILPQGVLLLLTVMCALGGEPWLRFCVGVPCFVVSLAVTWRLLSRESAFVLKLKRRFRKS